MLLRTAVNEVFSLKNQALDNVTEQKRYRGRDIVRELESYIVNNRLAKGVKLPSGAQIALKYHVSLKTAQRAMEALANKGLIGCIRGSGSYVKSNKTSQQQYRVALFFWGHPSEESFQELDYAAYGYYINSLMKNLGEHDFSCNVFYENSQDRTHLKLFQVPMSQYDAIIVAAGVLNTAADFLKKSPVPVILVHDDIVHPGPWHQVVYDYQPGFKAALEYFQKQGHQQFFIVSNSSPTNEVSQRRVEAILSGAEQLQILPRNLIAYAGKSSIVNSPILCGRDCAEYYCRNELLKYPVVSISDFVTYGFLSYMSEKNLQAGKDFKLISYDNLEKDLQNPSLKLGISAITHPKDEAVAAVIDLLESLIVNKAKKTEFYRTYFVPAQELVLRNSSG